MKFATAYNRTPVAERPKEDCSKSDKTEKSGWRTVHEMVDDLISAGELLKTARTAEYDYENEEQVGEFPPEMVTRAPGFDHADAQMLLEEQIERRRAIEENERLENEVNEGVENDEIRENGEGASAIGSETGEV